MLGSGHFLDAEEEPFSAKKLSYPPLPVRGAIKARIFSDIIGIFGTAFEWFVGLTSHLKQFYTKMLGSGHSLKVEEEPFSAKKLSYRPLPVRGAVKARIFSDIIGLFGTAFEWFVGLTSHLKQHYTKMLGSGHSLKVEKETFSAKKLSYRPLPVRAAIKARIFSDTRNCFRMVRLSIQARGNPR